MILRKTPVQLALLCADALLFLASGVAFYVVISRVAGPGLLGAYSLVFAWLLVFQSIGSAGIPELMMRELGRFSSEHGHYVGAGLILGLPVSLAVVPIMAVCAWLTHYDAELTRAIWVAALGLPAAMLSNVVRSGFISSRRSGLILLTRAVEFVLVLPLNLMLLLNGFGLTALITVVVAGRTVASLFGLWLHHRYVARVVWWPNMTLVRDLISPAVTFAFANSLGLLGVHMNTIILSLMAPVQMVGYFTAGMRLIEGLMLVPVLFGQFYMPQISSSLESNRAAGIAPFRRAFRVLFALTIPACVGLLVFPAFIVHILFGPDFGETIAVLRILGLFYIVYAADAQLSMILRAAGLQDKDLRILAINPAVNILVNFALIPFLGAKAAAIGLLSGGLSSSLLRYRHITKELGPPRWASFISPLVGWSLAAAGSAVLLSPWLPEWAQVSLYGLVSIAGFTNAARGAIPPPVPSPAAAVQTSREQ